MYLRLKQLTSKFLIFLIFFWQKLDKIKIGGNANAKFSKHFCMAKMIFGAMHLHNYQSKPLRLSATTTKSGLSETIHFSLFFWDYLIFSQSKVLSQLKIDFVGRIFNAFWCFFLSKVSFKLFLKAFDIFFKFFLRPFVKAFLRPF